MAEYDWYSRKTWTESDQADYFARLKRSRTQYHKAQYLWVQARELHKVGLSHEAVSLLDKMVGEFPDTFWLSTVWILKAEILSGFGEIDGAIVCYRQALAAERERPNHQTGAIFRFGVLATENQLTKLYDEVLTFLKREKEIGLEWPARVYSKNGTLAIIADYKGQKAKAKKHALIAIKAANQDDTGIRYHRKFGLVTKKKTKFHKAIESIALDDVDSFSN